MTSRESREQFLASLSSELDCGRLARRRILRELSHHLDDGVDELRESGLSAEAAEDEALRRLGDVEMIGSMFRTTGAQRRARWSGRALRSPAWIAVGAMTLVTMWAAELPQASGAQPTRNRTTVAHNFRCPAPASRPRVRMSGRRCRSRRP